MKKAERLNFVNARTGVYTRDGTEFVRDSVLA